MSAKYAVFPTIEDPKQNAKGDYYKYDEGLDEDTFFVLRRDDVFSVATLYSYASSVATLLEMDRIKNCLTDDERVRLDALALYVQQLAEAWQKHGSAKVPD